MDKRKISLQDLYKEAQNQANPAKQFVQGLMSLTNRSELTVRMWISGKYTPDPLIQKVIAEHLNVDAETLFSHHNKSNKCYGKRSPQC